MNSTTLSEKYQIVVPKQVRNMMKLKAGQKVYLKAIDDNQALLVREPSSYADSMIGLGKEVWKKLGGADKYIKRERSSWIKSSR